MLNAICIAIRPCPSHLIQGNQITKSSPPKIRSKTEFAIILCKLLVTHLRETLNNEFTSKDPQ